MKLAPLSIKHCTLYTYSLLYTVYLFAFSKEVHEEFNPPPEKPDFKSVTMKDYNKEDFVSVKPKPSAVSNTSW